MNIYTTLLDAIILCVLAVTIVFCLKLNRRISDLQSSKKEIESFIKALDASIINAHNSIVSLKEITQQIAVERQKYIDDGSELANDLSFMIKSGNRLIQRANEEMQNLDLKIDSVKAIDEDLRSQLSKLEEKTQSLKQTKSKRSRVKQTATNKTS